MTQDNTPEVAITNPHVKFFLYNHCHTQLRLWAVNKLVACFDIKPRQAQYINPGLLSTRVSDSFRSPADALREGRYINRALWDYIWANFHSQHDKIYPAGETLLRGYRLVNPSTGYGNSTPIHAYMMFPILQQEKLAVLRRYIAKKEAWLRTYELPIFLHLEESSGVSGLPKLVIEVSSAAPLNDARTYLLMHHIDAVKSFFTCLHRLSIESILSNA